jgi:hypothetical protein
MESIFILIFVWLFTAGYAFVNFIQEAKSDEYPVLFLFCLLLAPFAVGMVFMHNKKIKDNKNE